MFLHKYKFDFCHRGLIAKVLLLKGVFGKKISDFDPCIINLKVLNFQKELLALISLDFILTFLSKYQLIFLYRSFNQEIYSWMIRFQYFFSICGFHQNQDSPKNNFFSFWFTSIIRIILLRNYGFDFLHQGLNRTNYTCAIQLGSQVLRSLS